MISPPSIELSQFPDALARVLDSRPIACVRLALSTTDEDMQSRAGDLCRDVCHARDVAIVVQDHARLAETLGLDGVHLSDGARQVRSLRRDLGEDAIVGAHCRASRHDGMSAGEAGADYVAFGPVSVGLLGDGTTADDDLFAWWSEMIEVPVVAEGGLTPARVAALAGHTDFFGIGAEIWDQADPTAALATLLAEID
nr:thiamine phosphate synthase [Actibacterium sp. 188UL27-1]